MADTFEVCLAVVLRHEGGYVHHPKDPGGATMRGITQAVYDGWRSRRGLARISVRQIDDAELRAIYRVQYWDVIRGDDLPAGLDLATFDAAVNSGASQAAKWLQRAVGAAADGHVGEATIAAARRAHPITAIDALCDGRMAMLRKLSTWWDFGAGWTHRVKDVRERAIRMATVAGAGMGAHAIPAALPPADNAPAAPRAEPTDVAATRTPEAAGIGMTGAGAAGAAISEAAGQLQAVAPYSTVLQIVFGLVVLVGIGLTVWQLIRRARAGALA